MIGDHQKGFLLVPCIPLTVKDEVPLLPGIFFYVNEDGTLPEHIVYKIRQNATISQSTKLVRDLIYEPGPDWKSRIYYFNGFAWFQVRSDNYKLMVTVKSILMGNIVGCVILNLIWSYLRIFYSMFFVINPICVSIFN